MRRERVLIAQARRRWIGLLPRTTLVLGVLLSSACYVYKPAGTPPPPPGTEVRLLVGDNTLQRVSAEAGQPIAPYLTGQLVESGADSLRLSVLLVRSAQSYATQRTRQVFSVARTEVLQVEREELSWSRTLLVGAGVTALVVAILDQFTAIGDDPGNNNPGFPDAPSIRAGVGFSIGR